MGSLESSLQHFWNVWHPAGTLKLPLGPLTFKLSDSTQRCPTVGSTLPSRQATPSSPQIKTTPDQIALLLDLYKVHRPQHSFPLKALTFAAPGHFTSPSHPLIFSSLNQTPAIVPQTPGVTIKVWLFSFKPLSVLEAREVLSTISPNPPHRLIIFWGEKIAKFPFSPLSWIPSLPW